MWHSVRLSVCLSVTYLTQLRRKLLLALVNGEEF